MIAVALLFLTIQMTIQLGKPSPLTNEQLLPKLHQNLDAAYRLPPNNQQINWDGI